MLPIMPIGAYPPKNYQLKTTIDYQLKTINSPPSYLVDFS